MCYQPIRTLVQLDNFMPTLYNKSTMRVISTNEFREKLAEILTSIAKTDTPFVVSRFGKPLVKVIPYKKEDEKNDYRRFYGFLGKGKSGVAFENKLRRNKKEREYVENLRKGYVTRPR